MLLLHMQEIVPVDFRRAFCPLEGGGGGRHTGTRLTVPLSGTVLGHSQGFLQCHFSRCKVGSFKGKRCRPTMGRPLRPLASFRGCRSGP